MNIRDMRNRLGDTQSEFASRYNIPFRTIQNWEAGVRRPPEYLIRLLEANIHADLTNRRTVTLPKHSAQKINLPRRSDFSSGMAWLRAVCDCIGDPVVFALDEALMCQESFLGRNEEYLVWVYGDDAVSRFNGVVVIGNQISPYCVEEKNGLRYTNLNRTITDAIANESILDMQGITEAISHYYYNNGESFAGISVAPEQQERFDQLAKDAVEYYDS